MTADHAAGPPAGPRHPIPPLTAPPAPAYPVRYSFMSVSTQPRLTGSERVAVRLSLRLLLLSIISDGGPVT
jgi:hypothetical protein